MRQLIDEVIEMRKSASDAVGRLLADACLEICLQELTANDESLATVSVPTVDAVLECLSGVDLAAARTSLQS